MEELDETTVKCYKSDRYQNIICYLVPHPNYPNTSSSKYDSVKGNLSSKLAKYSRHLLYVPAGLNNSDLTEAVLSFGVNSHIFVHSSYYGNRSIDTSFHRNNIMYLDIGNMHWHTALTLCRLIIHRDLWVAGDHLKLHLDPENEAIGA